MTSNSQAAGPSGIRPIVHAVVSIVALVATGCGASEAGEPVERAQASVQVEDQPVVLDGEEITDPQQTTAIAEALNSSDALVDGDDDPMAELAESMASLTDSVESMSDPDPTPPAAAEPTAETTVETAAEPKSDTAALGGADAANKLAEVLAAITSVHGPSDNVASTVSSAIPFPFDVQSVADAVVISTGVESGAIVFDGNKQGRVTTRVRYVTDATIASLDTHYGDQLVGHDRYSGPDSVAYRGPDPGGFGLQADDFGDYRVVSYSWSARHYQDFDELVAAFSGWGGAALMPRDAEPWAVGYSVFNIGRDVAELARLNTTYRFEGVVEGEIRAALEDKLTADGWDWSAPRDGVLLAEGPMDGELSITHYDEGYTLVSVQGRFDLGLVG